MMNKSRNRLVEKMWYWNNKLKIIVHLCYVISIVKMGFHVRYHHPSVERRFFFFFFFFFEKKERRCNPFKSYFVNIIHTVKWRKTFVSSLFFLLYHSFHKFLHISIATTLKHSWDINIWSHLATWIMWEF